MKAQLFSVDKRDPLTSARALLQDIWHVAALEGLYLPVWTDAPDSPEGVLCQELSQLDYADPFSPVMPINQAPPALQAIRDHPHRRLGIFLRPCEWRTFRALLQDSAEPLTNVYAISTDCTGAMSEHDFQQLSGEDPLTLTREALHFASQGGILPSRHQSSCQWCEDPFPSQVDLHFELFGVPTDEHLILRFKDPEIAMALSQRSSGADVPREMLARRNRVLENLERWRAESFQKRMEQLGPAVISIENLIAHLQTCEPCQAALTRYCPLIDIESLRSAGPQDFAEARQWIGSCSGCGVCDRDCPDHFPLFDVIFALRT